MRLFRLDDPAQGGTVGHGDDMGAMRHLLRRGVGITVDGDHLDAEALQRDRDLLAKLSRAEQHDSRGR